MREPQAGGAPNKREGHALGSGNVARPRSLEKSAKQIEQHPGETTHEGAIDADELEVATYRELDAT